MTFTLNKYYHFASLISSVSSNSYIYLKRNFLSVSKLHATMNPTSKYACHYSTTSREGKSRNRLIVIVRPQIRYCYHRFRLKYDVKRLCMEDQPDWMNIVFYIFMYTKDENLRHHLEYLCFMYYTKILARIGAGTSNLSVQEIERCLKLYTKALIHFHPDNAI